MKNQIGIFFVILCLLPFSAWAQSSTFGLSSGKSNTETDSEVYEDPPQSLPALPNVEPPKPQSNPTLPVQGNQGYTMTFPELPPSRLCKKRDVLGMWKLSMVFETPAGTQVEDFGTYPYQYVLFNDTSIYQMYKSARDENSEPEVLRYLQSSNSKVLEQFVVDDNGVIFFYKDGVAVDSMACFIVANPLDPFTEGQMLFMPPPERATMRMVKAYNKVYSAPKKKNKKRHRRRG